MTKLNGDYVGFEFEYELPQNVEYSHVDRILRNIDTEMIFSVKEDMSLRRGVELVTEPIIFNENSTINDIAFVIRQLDFLKVSIRTSTHMHVNVFDLTPEERFSRFALFVLLEPYYRQTVSFERAGNPFCKWWSDIIFDGRFQINRDINGVFIESDRYMSLNLSSFVSHSTYEARFMESPRVDVIPDWSNLNNIVVSIFNVLRKAKVDDPRKYLEFVYREDFKGLEQFCGCKLFTFFDDVVNLSVVYSSEFYRLKAVENLCDVYQINYGDY